MKKLAMIIVLATFFFGGVVSAANLPFLNGGDVGSGKELSLMLANKDKRMNASPQNYIDALRQYHPDAGVEGEVDLHKYLQSLETVSCEQDTMYVMASVVSGKKLGKPVERKFRPNEKKCLRDRNSQEIVISLSCGNVGKRKYPRVPVVASAEPKGVEVVREGDKANESSKLNLSLPPDYSNAVDPQFVAQKSSNEDEDWTTGEKVAVGVGAAVVGYFILRAIARSINKNHDNNTTSSSNTTTATNTTIDGAGGNGNGENGTSMGGSNGQGNVAGSLVVF